MNVKLRQVVVDLKAPTSQSGGKVVSCDLDEACVQVDCDVFVEEVADVLDESPDAPDYVIHYCGVDYLDKVPQPKPGK